MLWLRQDFFGGISKCVYGGTDMMLWSEQWSQIFSVIVRAHERDEMGLRKDMWPVRAPNSLSHMSRSEDTGCVKLV